MPPINRNVGGLVFGTGIALGEILWPSPGSRVGGKHVLSLLFIFRNDTDETVHFTDERLYSCAWVDKKNHPGTIAPRCAGTFMLCGTGQYHPAQGSIWFRIGDGDSYQINIDFNVEYALNASSTYRTYMQRNPGDKYLTGWDSSKENHDVDLDVMLSYHNERDKRVPETFLNFSPSVVNLQGKLWTFPSGWKDDMLWYNVGVDNGGSELQWEGDKAFKDTQIGASPSAIVVGDEIFVFYHGFALWQSVNLAYLVVRNDGSVPRRGTLDAVKLDRPPSAVLYKDLIYVFYTDSQSRRLVWISLTKDMQTKERGEVKDFRISESPSAVVEGENIHIFYQASSRDGTTWHTKFDGTNWSHPDILENIGMSFSPAAIYDKAFGKLVVFHHAYKEREQLWHCKYDKSNPKNVNDTMVMNLKMTHSPSPVIYGDDKIYCFHNGAGDTHQLFYKALLRKDM